MRGQGVLHSAPSPASLSCSSRPRQTKRCTQSSRAALDDFSTQQHGQRQGLAGPARVFAPAAESRDATGSHDTSGSSVDLALEERATDAQPAGLPSWPSPVSIQEVTAPVAADRDIMNQNLVNIGERRNPQLQAAAKQIFGAGGKRLRPVIVFLVGRATIQLSGLSDLTERHRRLAEIIEMIHTASLVHDDVLDEADTRRGQPTVNKTHGNQRAVLVGDFLFARSSYLLAHLEDNEVIKLISQVIADFADGEIDQSMHKFDTDLTMEDYIQKSYYKTASLIAASCRASAIFSDVDAATKAAMFEYGRHLGLAFQVVDDILDFTRTAEQLGKPQGQDLMSGNLTAPALYALRHPQAGDELRDLIDSEFNNAGGLPRAIELVNAGGGIESARTLARCHAEQALHALVCLPESESKQSLKMMISYVLERLY